MAQPAARPAPRRRRRSRRTGRRGRAAGTAARAARAARARPRAGGPPRRPRACAARAPPNSRSIARSTSRWPPYAAGSIRYGRPPALASTFPPQRSPCSRAGGSGGPASSGRRSITASIAASAAGRQRPAIGRGAHERREPVLAVERRPVRARSPRRSSTAPSRRPAERRARRRGAERGRAGGVHVREPAAELLLARARRAAPRRSTRARGTRLPSAAERTCRRRRRVVAHREDLGHGEPVLDLAEPAQAGRLGRVLAVRRSRARLHERARAVVELDHPGVVDVAAGDAARGGQRASDRPGGRLGNHSRPSARSVSSRPRQAASTRSSTRSKPSSPP